MFLAEPPRSPYDLNFSLFGFPVRVHPWFWILTLVLGIFRTTEPTPLLTWIGVVFVSILIHELGHALAMRYYGWHARITLYALGGLATPESSASFREGHSNPKSQVLIAFAGPAAGFALAAVIVGLLFATQHRIDFTIGITVGAGDTINQIRLETLVAQLLYVNILWGILNLFPIYPLDGGHIAREILTVFNPYKGIVQSLWLSVISAGVLAVGLLLFGTIYGALLFGSLAYSSYRTLQAYTGGGYGGGGYGGGYGGGGYDDGYGGGRGR